jgi:hypothetical protein
MANADGLTSEDMLYFFRLKKLRLFRNKACCVGSQPNWKLS